MMELTLILAIKLDNLRIFEDITLNESENG